MAAVVEKLTILFVAANPTGTTQRQLDEEVRAVDEMLRQSEYSSRFELRSAWAVRHSDLQGLLLRFKPHIVHFSGRGSEASQILLRDVSDEQQPLRSTALTSLFTILRDNVRCVVLNACYSATQARGIVESIDCVVGMPRTVEDAAAVHFAAGFYLGLGFGRDVQTAFELGKNRIDLMGLSGAGATEILVRPGVQANSVVFVHPWLDTADSTPASEPLGMLSGVALVPTIPSAGIDIVPFLDRETHMGSIRAEYASPYFLVDAPAGYGKTALLTTLKQRATVDGWVCAYVCVDGPARPHISDVIQGLARDLDLTDDLGDAGIGDLTVGLATQLLEKRSEAIVKKGIMLLIDLGHTQHGELAIELASDFIPKMKDTLDGHSFFLYRHSRFRVVVAGRHLAAQMNERKDDYPVEFRVEQLSPLRFGDLLETTRIYLPGSTPEPLIYELATRIMFKSGGHPDCMASLLKLYRRRGGSPTAFFEKNAAEIDKLIRSEIDEVCNWIPDDLQPVLDTIGVFRKVNHHLLDYLMAHGFITGFENRNHLEDRLTTTFYLSHDGAILRNDNHCLLRISRLRRPQSAETAHRCCRSYLELGAVNKPETWAIECFYQFLQMHVHLTDDPKQREELQTLLHEEVRDVIAIIVKDLDATQKDYIRQDLGKALKEDHDLQFVVNYYLRKRTYDDGPFEELVRFADRFLT